MNLATPHRILGLASQAALSLFFLPALTLALGAQTPTPPPPPTPQHTTELPQGQGRDTVVRVCGRCHSPSILAANPRDRAAWEETITKMAGFGATATDEEFSDILEYLAKYVSPQATAKVNLNKALSPDLQATLDLSPRQADAIVAFRTKNGDYKSLDDLKKIPDLDLKKLTDKKDRITFQ